MTLEEKEQILTKSCVRAEDIMAITGFSKSMAYKIMKECREEFKGTAGIRNDAILTKSLFDYLGTSLEEELSLIIRAKELAKCRGKDYE